MKFPCLIDRRYCKTPVKVILYREGVSEDGEPLKALEYTGFCNWQDSAKTVLTAEKRLVELSGTAYFVGDIAPHMAVISDGEVMLYGSRESLCTKRKIFRGTKARNPDGTVNYTKLELI